MKKNLPVKRNPRYNEDENSLDFGDALPKELSVEEKSDVFMSKYMDTIDPVERYKKYFQSSAKGLDHILRDIKLYYKKLVAEDNKWTEKKYVEVINDLMENRTVISITTLDRAGLMYDKEQLASQRKSKRRRR